METIIITADYTNIPIVDPARSTLGFESYGAYLQYITLHPALHRLPYSESGEVRVRSNSLVLGDNHGAVVVNTRPVSQSLRFTKTLLSEGIRVIVAPASHTQGLWSTASLPPEIHELTRFSHIIFTSREAVDYLMELVAHSGHDVSSLPPVLAIGPGTVQSCKRHGLNIAFTGSTSEANAFAHELCQTLDARQSTLLLARGAGGREVLPATLKEHGFEVTELHLYSSAGIDHPASFLHEIMDSKPDYVVFTSSFAAGYLLDLLNKLGVIWSIPAISIGPPTSATLRQRGVQHITQASTYDIKGILTALKSQIRR